VWLHQVILQKCAQLGFAGGGVTLNFASMVFRSALQATLREVKQGLRIQMCVQKVQVMGTGATKINPNTFWVIPEQDRET